MTTSVLLLVLGGIALAGALNALHPAGGWAIFFTWPAAWVAVEMAPHLVALGTVAGIALAAAGGLAHAGGWIGLGCLVAADAIALPLILRARRTVVDFGSEIAELPDLHPPAPMPRWQVLLPFLAARRRGVRRIRGVEFARPGGRPLKLDVFVPEAPAAEPRPAIVHVHGGGWIGGSRHEQGIPLLAHMAANGWVGFNVDYRLSPRATFPDHVVDVKRAIAWVREHAEEYGVDPSFVAITGGSAGGHLTALAALTPDDRSLQPGFEDADTSVVAAVPFYGVYDLLDDDRRHIHVLKTIVERIVFKARRAKHPDKFRDASPIQRIAPDAPPFLVVHGERDSLVPVEEARQFVARLREVSRAPVVYAEMRGAEHAFDVIPSWRTIPVIEGIERFLASLRAERGLPLESRILQ